jgi:hypothetical protein
MDPVPDPLLLRKSGSAGNRTRDLWVCSQELGPLDHRGSRNSENSNSKYGIFSDLPVTADGEYFEDDMKY